MSWISSLLHCEGQQIYASYQLLTVTTVGMAGTADITHIIQAFRSALKVLQDGKRGVEAPVKSNWTLSYESLLEQFCGGKGLRWNREVSDAHTKMVYHINGDFFKIDVHITFGAVGDVWVHHQFGTGHPEACPHIAKALRLKNMTEFDNHITGFLKMYTSAPDKSQRPNFYICLSKLELDLMAVHRELLGQNVDLKQQILCGPCGLLSARRDVLAGRRLGTWASVGIRDSKTKTALPYSSLLRNVAKAFDGIVMCDFAPLDLAHAVEVCGYFVLEFDKPFIMLESTLKEIAAITECEGHESCFVQPDGLMLQDGLSVYGHEMCDTIYRKSTDDKVLIRKPTNARFIVDIDILLPDGKPVTYMELLEDRFSPAAPKITGRYITIVVDQHHAYTLASPEVTGSTVSEIPFSHPDQIAKILICLRRQAAMNQLALSCMRPLQENVEISTADPVSPSCKFVETALPLCSEGLMNLWIAKTYSIPVLLKTMIEYFANHYVPPPVFIPEPEPEPQPEPEPPVESSPIHNIMFTPSIESPPVFAQELSIPSPVVLPDSPGIKLEKPATPVVPLVASIPSPLPPPIPTIKIPKMDKLLSKSRSSRTVDVPMDQDIHAMKMKQLYDKNKKVTRTRPFEEEIVVEIKPTKKRKLSLEHSYPVPFGLPSFKGEPPTLEVAAEPQRPEQAIIKIRAVNDDSPHGSPTITLKLPVKQPVAPSTEAHALQSNLVRDVHPVKKEKKRSKHVEPVVDVKHSEPKRAKKDTSELEALLMKKHSTNAGTLSTSSPPKASKHTTVTVSSSVSTKSAQATQPAATTPMAKLLTPSIFLAVTSSKSSTLPTTSSTSTKISVSAGGNQKTSSASITSAKSPLLTIAPAKSPAPVVSAKSPAPSSKSHHSESSSASKKAGTTSPSSKSTAAKEKYSSANAANSKGSSGTSTAKSPSPSITITAPPLFSVPKMPSLSSLPRIPKKSAIIAATVSSPTKTSSSLALATPASLVTEPTITTLLLLPTTGTRPPLLPTPDMEPYPSVFQTESQDSRYKPVWPSVSVKAASSSVVSGNPAERLNPRPSEKEKPTLITLVDATEDFVTEEASKKGLSIVVPAIDQNAALSAGITTSPSTKGRNRSLSAVLDRLKSRVEPSDGSSHDSSDGQDCGFKQGGGGDAVDGRERGESELASFSGVLPFPPSGLGREKSSKEPQTAVPANKQLENIMIQHAQVADKSKQILVPYSSGDSSSEAEEDRLTVDTSERPGLKIPVITMKRQMSPEILERPASVQVPLYGHGKSSGVSRTGGSRGEDVTGSTGQIGITRSSSEERTSPLILDDALLDAAFFATEE